MSVRVVFKFCETKIKNCIENRMVYHETLSLYKITIMLQRVQTIYLVLALACVALQYVFPTFIISKEFGGKTHEIEMFLSAGWITKIALIVMILLAVGAIILFKNRGKQIMVTRFGLITSALFAIAVICLALFGKDYLIDSTIIEGITSPEEIAATAKVGMGIGYYLAFITVAFFFLAIRGIRADEKLVKSLDRLR